MNRGLDRQDGLDVDDDARVLPDLVRLMNEPSSFAGSAQACHDTYDHRDEPDMLTTEERRTIRLGLIELGFERVIASMGSADGEYRETFRLGRNSVTLTWGPKTPIR